MNTHKNSYRIWQVGITNFTAITKTVIKRDCDVKILASFNET